MVSALTARADNAASQASWLSNPQRKPLRRAMLKIHLWTALFLGAYVLLISITGSAVVMRPAFSRWASPPNFVEAADVRLSEYQLGAIIHDLYPEHRIVSLDISENAYLPAATFLERNGKIVERRFDPYTGEDHGAPFPFSLQAIEWLVDLHDNLLSGQTGRKINGFGGLLFMVVILTGAVLWWPGRGRWLNSMTIGLRSRGYRLVWRLHSFLGFWSFGLLAIWGLTAMYFAFPSQYETLIDLIDPDLNDFDRPGLDTLLWMIDGHFGRFRNLYLQALWVVLGLIPSALFVTGFLIWWMKRPKKRAAVDQLQ